MANGSRVSLPQGFDLDAMKSREALTFDDIRDIAKRLQGANKAPRPQAPGRVANVFRRRGQWSSAWWQSEPDAQAVARCLSEQLGVHADDMPAAMAGASLQPKRKA